MQRRQQTKQALGSTAYITLVGDITGPQASDNFTVLWKTIDDFEERFSRFVETSELTKVNRQAGRRVSISPAFHDLVAAARQLSLQTDGLFNPFILPDLQRAGYVASWIDPQLKPISYEERRLVAIDTLELGSDWLKLPPDSALDFGGIGKGYLLDLLLPALSTMKLDGYWVSLGGDIICAGNDLSGPWRVSIQDAILGDKVAGVYVNTTGEPMAIATSGVTKRAGVHNGQPWHHLIDPRTGRPSQTDVLTATVISRSATKADVLAKCLVLLGPEPSKRFIDEQSDILGSLIQTNQHKQPLKPYTTGVLKERKRPWS